MRFVQFHQRRLLHRRWTYFLAVGGANGWPRSFPRSLIAGRWKLIKFKVLESFCWGPTEHSLHLAQHDVVRDSPGNETKQLKRTSTPCELTFRPRSRWRSAASRWSSWRGPSDLSPSPAGPAGWLEPRWCRFPCVSVPQSLGRVSRCFSSANAVCWFQRWLRNKWKIQLALEGFRKWLRWYHQRHENKTNFAIFVNNKNFVFDFFQRIFRSIWFTYTSDGSRPRVLVALAKARRDSEIVLAIKKSADRKTISALTGLVDCTFRFHLSSLQWLLLQDSNCIPVRHS